MTIKEIYQKYYGKENGDRTFLVVVPHYWGRGDSVSKAKREARRAGYSGRFPKKHTGIYSFPKGAKPHVTEMGSVMWDGAKEAITIIQQPK